MTGLPAIRDPLKRMQWEEEGAVEHAPKNKACRRTEVLRQAFCADRRHGGYGTQKAGAYVALFETAYGVFGSRFRRRRSFFSS